MSDMLDEINDEVQQEKLARYIISYWHYFVLGIILVIILIAIILSVKDKNSREYENLGSLYYKANKADGEEIDINLLNEIIKKQKSGYYFLASLEKAAILIKDKKLKEAVNLYDELALHKNTDRSIQYLAKLLALTSLISNEPEDLNNINKRFEQILKKDNPFYASSLMAKVDWLIKNNNNDEAMTYIDMIIKEENAPNYLKEKAKILAERLK
ncbi:MAG: hypothetical protein ACK4OM_03255 [Alphaproteobacteria bacterium]